jgi:hypothetical protein
LVEILEIVFDSQHPARLAGFWAAVLDGYRIRGYDDAEIERLATLGYTPETDPSVAVDGPGPTFFFQKTEQPKRSRNRLHLDLAGGSRATEVAQMVELGATIREELDDHTVMLDPEGNEFCVRDPE